MGKCRYACCCLLVEHAGRARTYRFVRVFPLSRGNSRRSVSANNSGNRSHSTLFYLETLNSAMYFINKRRDAYSTIVERFCGTCALISPGDPIFARVSFDSSTACAAIILRIEKTFYISLSRCGHSSAVRARGARRDSERSHFYRKVAIQFIRRERSFPSPNSWHRSCRRRRRRSRIPNCLS